MVTIDEVAIKTDRTYACRVFEVSVDTHALLRNAYISAKMMSGRNFLPARRMRLPSNVVRIECDDSKRRRLTIDPMTSRLGRSIVRSVEPYASHVLIQIVVWIGDEQILILLFDHGILKEQDEDEYFDALECLQLPWQPW